MAARRTSEDGYRTVDYVVAAVFNLGGKSRSVDIEDAAMEAFRLAPHRFRWRKYGDQVDLAQVRDGLSDARKPENGGLVAGDRKHGWALTPSGVQHAEILSKRLDGRAEAPEARARLDIPVLAAERHRVVNSRAIAKAQSGQIDAVTKQDVRELLRVDQYVTPEKYDQRVALVTNALADDPPLLSYVQELEQRYRDGALSK